MYVLLGFTTSHYISKISYSHEVIEVVQLQAVHCYLFYAVCLLGEFLGYTKKGGVSISKIKGIYK